METKEIVREVVNKGNFIKRRDRDVHPDGHFDKASRWYPSDEEECDCCRGIRSPSRRYPYSYLVHCRSAAHVRNLVAKWDYKKVRAAFAWCLKLVLLEDKGVDGLLQKVCSKKVLLAELMKLIESDQSLMQKHADVIIQALKKAKKPKEAMEVYLMKDVIRAA